MSLRCNSSSPLFLLPFFSIPKKSPQNFFKDFLGKTRLASNYKIIISNLLQRHLHLKSIILCCRSFNLLHPSKRLETQLNFVASKLENFAQFFWDFFQFFFVNQNKIKLRIFESSRSFLIYLTFTPFSRNFKNCFYFFPIIVNFENWSSFFTWITAKFFNLHNFSSIFCNPKHFSWCVASIFILHKHMNVYIYLSNVGGKNPLMNCKSEKHTLSSLPSVQVWEKGKKNADDLLDDDDAWKKSFIIFHRNGTSKKAIKTLKQIFFFMFPCRR